MAAQPRRKVTWQSVKKNSIKLEAVIEEYLQHHHGLNHSPKTIRWYADILGAFNAFLGPDTALEELSSAGIRAYQSHLRTRRKPDGDPLSDESLHDHARGIRAFLAWLFREDYLDEDLAARVDMPRVAKKELKVLSDEEITTIFRQLPMSDDQGCRNLLIVSLMIDCGLRLSEVSKLDVDDVFIEEGLVRVQGKGRREERVPFGATTAKVLRRYLQHFRPHIAGTTNALFINQYGGRLKPEAIKSMVQRLRDRTGIDRLHPHLLRHTAATRLLANGCDLHTVQRILRHRNVTTTTRYLHLLNKRRTIASPPNLTRLPPTSHAALSSSENAAFRTSVTSSAPTLPLHASFSDIAVKPATSMNTALPSISRATVSGSSFCHSTRTSGR